jgi:hypothetical protein
MLTRKRPLAPTSEERRAAAVSALMASRPAPAARVVMATPESIAGQPVKARPAKLGRAQRTRADIRASANGEACHVRLLGTCNGRTDTTVWSHWPGLDADRGLGLKAVDVAGAYACAACHDAVDGRTHMGPGHDRGAIAMAWMLGHLRSLVTLTRKGLL